MPSNVIDTQSGAITMSKCPCNSSLPYNACCGLYLDDGKAAPSAEALMRSRYTAYTKANIEYIEATMCGEAMSDYNANEARESAERVTWLGLEVKAVERIDADHGAVEFVAHFIDRGQLGYIHERSQFQRVDGCWFYTDGELLNIK